MDQIHKESNTVKLHSNRGVALLELLLAFGLLGLLSVVIFLTMRMTRQAQAVHSKEVEQRQLALVTKMRVLDLLRGTRLITPHRDNPQSAFLEFQKPMFVGDVLAVDSSGRTIWGDPRALKIDSQGRLIHSHATGSQADIVARLGALAEMTVHREAPYVRMEIRIQEEATSEPVLLTIKAYVPVEVQMRR